MLEFSQFSITTYDTLKSIKRKYIQLPEVIVERVIENRGIPQRIDGVVSQFLRTSYYSRLTTLVYNAKARQALILPRVSRSYR